MAIRHTSNIADYQLRSWFAQGQDVGALLPVLQTYMGHSSIGDTAYYLRLTAESYPETLPGTVLFFCWVRSTGLAGQTYAEPDQNVSIQVPDRAESADPPLRAHQG
jgi:hypothetical protein